MRHIRVVFLAVKTCQLATLNIGCGGVEKGLSGVGRGGGCQGTNGCSMTRMRKEKERGRKRFSGGWG